MFCFFLQSTLISSHTKLTQVLQAHHNSFRNGAMPHIPALLITAEHVFNYRRPEADQKKMLVGWGCLFVCLFVCFFVASVRIGDFYGKIVITLES